MRSMECHACRNDCICQRQREWIWRVIAGHHEGLQLCEVVDLTTLPCDVVVAIVEELHGDDNVYFDWRTDRWHAEMSPD